MREVGKNANFSLLGSREMNHLAMREREREVCFADSEIRPEQNGLRGSAVIAEFSIGLADSLCLVFVCVDVLSNLSSTRRGAISRQSLNSKRQREMGEICA